MNNEEILGKLKPSLENTSKYARQMWGQLLDGVMYSK